MSYDLAIWQGDVPSSDKEAARMHGQLYKEYLDSETPSPAVEAISSFVEALTARWPDAGVGEDTPWAATPLLRGASGPYVYIGISWPSAEVISPQVAEVAAGFGLICFDPQQGSVRSH
jgi:hypothetical protein